MKSSQSRELETLFAEKTCRSCQTCDAPLCPLDKDIIWRYWFPDEAICKAKKFGEVDWIRNQRKIKKRAVDNSRYFTLEMLNRNCVIRRGIKGLNPGLPCDTEEERIRRWLARHPPRRSISTDERQRLADRMSRLRTLRK